MDRESSHSTLQQRFGRTEFVEHLVLRHGPAAYAAPRRIATADSKSVTLNA